MSNMNVTSIIPNPPAPPPIPLKPIYVQSKADSKQELPISQKDDLDFLVGRLTAANEKFSKIFYLCNRELKPQIQDGPTCGLVALSIASTLTSKTSINVNNIFEKAYSKGYTKQGEIFNAEFLADLAENYNFKAKIIKGGLNLHLCCIIQNLVNKGLILVPYDADHNNSPCCKEGFNAHWAVINGFVIMSDEDAEDNRCTAIQIESSVTSSLCNCASSFIELNESNLKFDCDNKNIFIIKNFELGKECKVSRGEIYLIGRQGKSKHLGLWSFEDMSKSNDNLIHFRKNKNPEDFILPEGGPKEGLKGKGILLQRS